MNEFYFNGTALGEVDVNTSEQGTKYGTLKVNVRKAFKNKEGEYDHDLLQVTMFNSILDSAEGVRDGSCVLVRGHIVSNNYSKEDKLYMNASLVADRIELLNQF